MDRHRRRCLCQEKVGPQDILLSMQSPYGAFQNLSVNVEYPLFVV
jgi:hypothetical protein